VSQKQGIYDKFPHQPLASDLFSVESMYSFTVDIKEVPVQVLIDGTTPSMANYATAHIVGFTQSMAVEVLRRDLARLVEFSIG